MKRILLPAAALFASLALASTATAQTATPAAATSVSSERYLMQNGQVVLMQGGRPSAISKNVVLRNGTKINYKSGIVELPGGKMTTLKEGDYVRPDGGIVFATPSSAAQARGDNSVPTSAQFDKYVDTRPTPNSSADVEARLTVLNNKITLMGEKIQLLNQKISLLSTNAQRPTDTSQLDQQIKDLDAKLK
ncbi:DUF6799 domain-containing protein [Hymenobacter sp. AT01-02]|uniref:DUF6799 domain-containing protein n=1 Tax=Hymenobacter sp. AT01-02 TaxID=1571877 RepID=UPI0005F22444|nr:DUF6799 domain-containing protein [Hymenobacter sp. AT01-02]